MGYHGDCYEDETRSQVSDPALANLISSRVEGSRKHAPVLDIDHAPVRVVPSSTPGHSHLYIDVAMSWRRYRKLLKALMKARIIDRDFYQLSIDERASFVRRPGLNKVDDAKFIEETGPAYRIAYPPRHVSIFQNDL